jgi:ribosomal protein S18 acetylase RimI-like enzyme
VSRSDQRRSHAAAANVVIADLRSDELPLAAGLMGRAYLDNPLTIALIGNDPELRRRVNEVIFGLRIAAMKPPPLAARDAAEVVGVCGFDPPGGSAILAEDQRKLRDALSAGGSDILMRAMSMLTEWERRTPKEPHWHLGPVGVEPARQGTGIGNTMVRAFCAKMDAESALAFLETDQEKNARFYEKFGFVTVDEAQVIGIPMWFMMRHPNRAP